MKWFIIMDNSDNKQKIIKVENDIEQEFRLDIKNSKNEILSEGNSLQDAFNGFTKLIEEKP